MNSSEVKKKMNSSEVIAAEGKAEEVQNNGLLFDPDNLPLGYKFGPTDTELLIFLTKKIHHQPLPPNNIAQVNLYVHHPDQLAARYKTQRRREKERYYFTPRERKYTNGQRPKRSIEDGDGYWKATGVEQEIEAEEEEEEEEGKNVIIGYKRALVFYQGKHPHGIKTNWIMHEFRLAALPPHPSPPTDDDIVNDTTHNKRFDDYVLCRVYKNIRSNRGLKRSRDVDPKNIDASTTSSSKIPRVVDYKDRHDERENNQVTANSGGGGTEYVEENLQATDQNGSYIINHQTLQNQKPFNVEMAPQIPCSVYAPSVFLHKNLPMAAGADVFWPTHDSNNNHLLMDQSSDFTNLKPAWEMSIQDFYAKNVCINGRGLMICSSSTMDLNPGGDIMSGCGCYTTNSNIDTSTTMPIPKPMDLKPGYMPSTGDDTWANTCNPNIGPPPWLS